MKRTCIALGLTLIAATVAVAHQGVENPAVKARMHGMSTISENLKALAKMSNGATEFNAEMARLAAASIAEHASAAPGLFEANETDPMSEARQEIWTDFEDFTAKAVELETVATGLSISIKEPSELPAAINALGATCKSCHSVYRLKR